MQPLGIGRVGVAVGDEGAVLVGDGLRHGFDPPSSADDRTFSRLSAGPADTASFGEPQTQRFAWRSVSSLRL
jgi:hypothetical protein